jgi:hypothetical protein
MLVVSILTELRLPHLDKREPTSLPHTYRQFGTLCLLSNVYECQFVGLLCQRQR